jgi:hypothetical protein
MFWRSTQYYGLKCIRACRHAAARPDHRRCGKVKSAARSRISTIFVAARARKVSGSKMFGDPRRICPTFQRLSQNDVCEFESSQPSQAVRSLRCDLRVCENRRLFGSQGTAWLVRLH